MRNLVLILILTGAPLGWGEDLLKLLKPETLGNTILPDDLSTSAPADGTTSPVWGGVWEEKESLPTNATDTSFSISGPLEEMFLGSSETTVEDFEEKEIDEFTEPEKIKETEEADLEMGLSDIFDSETIVKKEKSKSDKFVLDEVSLDF